MNDEGGFLVFLPQKNLCTNRKMHCTFVILLCSLLHFQFLTVETPQNSSTSSRQKKKKTSVQNHAVPFGTEMKQLFLQLVRRLVLYVSEQRFRQAFRICRSIVYLIQTDRQADVEQQTGHNASLSCSLIAIFFHSHWMPFPFQQSLCAVLCTLTFSLFRFYLFVLFSIRMSAVFLYLDYFWWELALLALSAVKHYRRSYCQAKIVYV